MQNFARMAPAAMPLGQGNGALRLTLCGAIVTLPGAWRGICTEPQGIHAGGVPCAHH